MERKVGEIFEDNGEWYQCVERPNRETSNIHCELCDFLRPYFCCPEPCNVSERLDKKEVIFKKLEKVGEPEIINGKKVQSIVTGYVGCAFCIFKKGGACLSGGTCKNRGTRTIYVEVKQNKEDMEEREYSEEDMKNNPRFKHHKNIEQVINMQKMKPFDLEAAKAGKPVCTRDGIKARIICFDVINKSNYPIIALLEDKGCEDNRGLLHCNNCGGTNILKHAWVDANTLEFAQEDWANNEYWCEDCNEVVDIAEEEETNESNKDIC